MATTSGVEALAGRERELEQIDEMLERASREPELLLLEGEPGIGKTSLWRAGVELARKRGFRILSTRPAETEAKLSFSGLGDLLAEVTDEMGALPLPQRSALRVALFLEEPQGKPPAARAISVATLAVLQRLADLQPLLVAVDDVQWLDAATARTLAFALRRVGRERIAVLVTARPGAGLRIEDMRRAEIRPLGPDAINRVIHDALSTPPPRQLLRRIEEVSGGNPFYALEIARAVERNPGPFDPAGPLPLPPDLRALVRDRLRTLPAESRRALTAAAALAHPLWSHIEQAVGGGGAGLRAAVDAGVLELEGDAVRFDHPLLSSVVYSDTDPTERRRLHRQLAAVVSDPEERARHVAIAVEPPDSGVAAALEQAANRAFERGAVDGAAELSEQALRFTPEGSVVAAHRRLLSAVGYLARSGRKRRARELVSDAYSATEPGAKRAQIAVTATWLGLWSSSLTISRLREAMAEAEGDRTLLTDLHGVLAHELLFFPDLPAAAYHAAAAVRLAEQLGDDARLTVALVQSGWVALFMGKDLDRSRIDLALALEASAGNPFGDVTVAGRFLGFALATIDQLDEARERVEATVAEERRRGDTGVTWSLQTLAWIETLAGHWERAQALAEETLETAREIEERIQGVLALRALARLAALRGEPDETRTLAAEGLRLAAEAESPLTRAELLSTLGLLELSLGDIDFALSHLDETAQFAEEMGLEEPGILRFVPDRVEALVAAGELERAVAATGDLEQQARRLGRVSANAGVARCRGLIASARGDLETALTCLAAARDAAPVDQPFELARTMLVHGAVLRKARRNSEARRSLTEAIAIFDRLGARLWTRKAQAELARLGGRRAQTGRLTPTEQQIADLVASGKSNDEVARILHLSPKTVEWNLSKVYKKLRIASRTELAATLAKRPA